MIAKRIRQVQCAALAAFLLAASAADALAQSMPAGRFRIYAITFRGKTDVENGFQEYFATRGIPVEITWRDIGSNPSKLPALVEEIRRLKPDLVYTWGTSVTLGVVGAYDTSNPAAYIRNVPVVFTLVAAPVQARIVPDLTAPGRNVTGVFHVAPTETQMKAMASYRPFKSVGVIYTPTEQNSVVIVEELRAVGKKLGFSVVARPFGLDGKGNAMTEGAQDLVRDMKRQNVDWLYLPPDSFLGRLAQKVVIPTAMEEGLPTFASTEQLMQAGALAGLVSRYYAIGQFTAYKTEQILVKRIPPAKIPVETLTRFSFQVNMAGAEALKLPPPLSMFNYAELLTAKGAAAR